MSSKIRTPNDEAAILRRVMQPRNGNLTKTAARAILGWNLTEEDRARMNDLVQRNQRGTLTAEELAELHGYLRVGIFLDLMHSKARLSLKREQIASGR